MNATNRSWLTFYEDNLPSQSDDRRRWGRVAGDSGLFIINELSYNREGPLVVITSSVAAAVRLETSLKAISSHPEAVLLFPDWETLPYDHFSPHQDIISQRLATLYQLPRLDKGIVIAASTTLMRYLMPRDVLEAHSLVLKQGQDFDREGFRQHLESLGYRATETVIEHGEYAVRGSLFDVFPMGHDTPYRLDLFDHEIDTIRAFDPETQRTTHHVQSVELLPAHECLTLEPYITNFRQNWRERYPSRANEHPLYQQISRGQTAAGIESYLPLFYEQTASFFDYLPDQALIIRYQPLQSAAEQFWSEVKERYEQYCHDINNLILDPQTLFIQPHNLFHIMNRFPQIELTEETLPDKKANTNAPISQLPNLAAPAKQTKPLSRLANYLESTDHYLLLCAESKGRREILTEQLHALNYGPEIIDQWPAFLNTPSRLAITVLPLEGGFHVDEPGLSIVCEADLFEDHQPAAVTRRQRGGPDPERLVRSLSEIKAGDPVVHINHGIGRYQGLQVIQAGDQTAEYLTIEYAQGDRVYVPVTQLHLISRYSSGDTEHAPVHQLGSKQWEKTKRKAAQKARDVAAELLDIYARRQTRQGLQCQPPNADYYAFANDFPFNETPDQQTAIDQVISDMTSEQPMDRLICGDVGFGKTEVAMRAAFLAVQSGWQVAMLVPTTLLAEQHFQSFTERFSSWPVKIEHLSRFRSSKEQQQVLEQLQTGQIDIVIGTHKLIQQKNPFKHLGLLVIDEEQRFGVRQKERIKAWRSVVDVLTLTATPIPRTLNMAFAQLRDLSIIATPPERRLSVKTFVRPYRESLIREAALREIMRGGQVYFLHNEVATIDRIANEVTQLLPEARIAVAHGQMNERQLERVMSDFYHRRSNVLVCTSIIESGLDIPTANTIIINRAERFGLAQLHQLRGRVGRSHHQAYAYLLTTGEKAPTTDAEKRLQAIEELEDLGAGFSLATHDLEIRGAGELLGEGQSGQMEAVGFDLYQEMLEKAAKAIQSGQDFDPGQPLEEAVEINLNEPALIPEDYIPDTHTRLSLYKRLANVANQQQLDAMHQEMVDRFGLLPQQAKNLIKQTELRIKAQNLGIKKIEAKNGKGYCDFQDQPKVSPETIIQLIQQKPAYYQLKGTNRLQFELNNNRYTDSHQPIHELLEALS